MEADPSSTLVAPLASAPSPSVRYDAVTLGLVLALLSFAFALGFQRTLNFDYGWHLRAGEWIAANASVPRVDAWTLSHEGERWIDLHWLFQLALFQVWSLGGHAGVTLAKAVLVMLVALVTVRRSLRSASPLAAGVATTAMLVLIAPRAIVRPELVSLLLLAVQVALLDRVREVGAHRRRRYGIAIVAVQLVWVNVHGLFAVGLALIAIHAVAEGLRGAAQGDIRETRCQQLGIVFVGALLASLLNPNGLDGALFPLRQLGIMSMTAVEGSDALLSEMLRPFDPRVGLAPGAALGFAVFAAATALAMLASVRRLRLVDPLVFGAFLFLALKANRNVALFAVVSAPIFARAIASAFETFFEGRGRETARLRLPATVGFSAALLVASAFALRGDVFPLIAYERESGLGLQAAWYPQGAAEFIREHNLPGPVANDMRDGGQLLFDLDRDRQILTDGRFAGLGGERRFEITRLSDLDRLHREMNFGSVVISYALQPRERLLRELASAPQWRLVFVDDVSLVAVPVSLAARRGLASVELGSEVGFAPVVDGDRAASRRLEARALWLGAGGRFDRAAELLASARTRAGAEAASPLLARWLLLANRTTEARSEARRAAAASRDPWELTGLANLLLRLDDREGAQAALEQATAIDASYTPAIERLSHLRKPGPASVRAALALPRPTPWRRGPTELRSRIEDASAVGLSLLLCGVAVWRERAGS